MKKKRAKRRPDFRQLPSWAFNLRRREAKGHLAVALILAVNRARKLGFGSAWDDMESVLRIAVPWIGRDILRAHLLKDGPPPAGTKYGIAFIPAGGVIEDRCYLIPPVTSGGHPMRMFVVAVAPDDYGLLMRDGLEAFLAHILGKLRDVGAMKLEK